MPGGRPLKFKTPEELQARIDEYFAYCEPHPEQVVVHKFHEIEEEYINDKGEKKTHKITDRSRAPQEVVEWRISERIPYTITGLANFLGTSRQTIINYESKDEFFDTIKAAKDKVEEYWEHQLLGSHATGPIFNLKNNYDWKDKTETDLNHSGDVQFINQVPRPKDD
jgi:DNA-binding XRE family transcriptional regulator